MIQCFNYKTSELRIYDSIETACKDLHTSYTTLINCIYRRSLFNKTIMVFKGNITEDDMNNFPGIKYSIQNCIDKNTIECFTLDEIKEYIHRQENKQVGSDHISRTIRKKYKMFNKYYITKTHGK